MLPFLIELKMLKSLFAISKNNGSDKIVKSNHFDDRGICYKPVPSPSYKTVLYNVYDLFEFIYLGQINIDFTT